MTQRLGESSIARHSDMQLAQHQINCVMDQLCTTGREENFNG